MRIRTKLALSFLAVATASAAAVGFAFIRLQDRDFEQTQGEERRHTLEGTLQVARESELANDPLMLLDHLSFRMKNMPEISWCQVERNGVLTRVNPTDERQGWDVLVEAGPVPGSADKVELAYSRPHLEQQRALAHRRALENMSNSVAAVLPVALALAVLLSLSFSRRIQRLNETLDEIGKGRFGVRAPDLGTDEIGRLAANINLMSSRLGELEEMKKTFAASVTHELRSPLAAIESGVRLILDAAGARSPDETDILRRIQANASRLGHFVTNLLEMARIERGKFDMHPQMTALRPLLEDAVFFFEPKAREAGISIHLNGQESLPKLRLDPDLMTQVISNLISNALKFTPRGGQVKVTARQSAADGREWIECAVQDTGVGIPEEALSRLFLPFERVRNPMRVSGAGLGLSIAKAIVEMHGGKMRVESEVGRGSRFIVSLPMK